MPCFGYSIPARHCITGSKLRNVDNTICGICYALKGRYSFSNVQDAMERRFQSLQDERWVEAIVTAIRSNESSGYFRWHDSGDLQGVWHLAKIVEVAHALPTIRFWLPTREYGIVGEFLRKGGKFPSNLTVRLSSLTIGGNEPAAIAKRLGLVISGAKEEGFNCPAPMQGNKCLACRKCWDKRIQNVTYVTH
jgi:hypothetical protein